MGQSTAALPRPRVRLGTVGSNGVECGFGPGWRGWLGRLNLLSRSCRAHSWYRFAGASLIAEKKVWSAPLWIKNGGCKTKGDMARNAVMKVEYSEGLRT